MLVVEPGYVLDEGELELGAVAPDAGADQFGLEAVDEALGGRVVVGSPTVPIEAVRDLVASIRTWISNWNDDHKPYVWHKSADEILDSLAACCQRINDSGH